MQFLILTQSVLKHRSLSQRLLLRWLAFTFFFSMLTACGGGSGSNGDSDGLPDQPQNVVITAIDSGVEIVWDAVGDDTSFEVCQALESISDATACLTFYGGTLYQDLFTNNVTISDLDSGTVYYFSVIPVNGKGQGTASDVVQATPLGFVEPEVTGNLNDSGITTCGNYVGGINSSDNDLDCSDTTDSNGNPIPQQQDALYGRDVTHYDDSDGHAGFSYIKLDENGDYLEASATSWSCVKDNVTGLIWQVKTDDDGLHDKDHEFSWYNSDGTSNGGDAGDQNTDNDVCYGYTANVSSTYCNTEAYIARVNTAGLCGATSGWRLPTVTEIASLSNLNQRPALNTDYFPNEIGDLDYWVSNTYATDSSMAWAFYLYSASDSFVDKTEYEYIGVRLVRSQ